MLCYQVMEILIELVNSYTSCITWEVVLGRTNSIMRVISNASHVPGFLSNRSHQEFAAPIISRTAILIFSKSS